MVKESKKRQPEPEDISEEEEDFSEQDEDMSQD